MKGHFKGKRAFVLLGLLILLLGLICLALWDRHVIGPTPLSRATEVVRKVVQAEREFRNRTLRDEDGDGKGEFVPLSRLLPAVESLGFPELRGSALGVFKADLNEALYNNEYIVKVLVPTDPELAEGHACIVAWPLRRRSGISFWTGRDESADVTFLYYFSPEPVSRSQYAKADGFYGRSGEPRFSGWGNGPEPSDIFRGEPFRSKPDFRKWPISTYLDESQRPSLGYRHLKQIAVTLYAYECEHGHLPYHPSGPEHALYLLKPYLTGTPQEGIPDDVTLFDCPDSEHRINGPSRWDEAEKRLVDGDYEYLNPRPVTSGERERYSDRVIVAEKSGLRDSGKWFVTRPFPIWWYPFSLRGRHFELLGKEYSDFAAPRQEWNSYRTGGCTPGELGFARGSIMTTRARTRPSPYRPAMKKRDYEGKSGVI